MSCNNDCREPVAFPKIIFNRPGLPTIDYRIGTYADLREHMLLRLDESAALADWTHRLPDDPGIALIEAAAEVGDILSFYHDLYANEAYLGTAKWRESVADLVRLLGYRLAPGVAGRARFAFKVKGTLPVVLPAGMGIKAQLDGDDKPSVFETSAESIALPALSQFNLYRPRQVPDVRYGTDTFTLILDAGATVTLKAGDRIMVGVPRTGGASFDHTQVLVVDKIRESFGSTIVKMKGGITSLKQPPHFSFASALFAAQPLASLQAAAPALSLTTQPTVKLLSLQLASPVFATVNLFPPLAILSLLAAGLGTPTLSSTPRLQAWKLGSTHRHFGHNAPAAQVTVNDKGRATTSAVSYVRRLNTTTGAPAVPSLTSTQLPLDGEVASVVAGTRLLIEANLSSNSSGTGGAKRLLERRVAQIDRQSMAWGPLTGASTVMSIDDDLAISESGTTLGYTDIRGVSFHEVVGDPFVLHADFAPTAASNGTELNFYGAASDAAALAKRDLLFVGPGDTLVSAAALSSTAAGVDANQPQFHRVLFDRAFQYAQFDHDAPQVTVYGNLVETTQGKTEAQVTLGDGDARAVFQTFAVPKTPLTYLLDTTQAPPQIPELHVWVDGIEWAHVDSLFGRGPKERVYIVREDADGKSWVQFGDGKTGARLRSGRGNVVAIYRTGDGAHGPLKADAKPQVDKKVVGLDAGFLLEPVTGGAEPESADGARVAAPGTMQSLGRIVSLADYEAESLAIPGVLKARAAWTSVDGAQVIRVTILTASSAAADAAAAADALRSAVRARGTARCPLLVVQGGRTPVSLHLVVGYDPTRRADDLRVAILEALGATGEEGNGIDSAHGLFSWQRRQFGEGVHGSQVVAAVQNVSGVTWVRLTALSVATATLFTSTQLHLTISSNLNLIGLQPALALQKVPVTQRSLACAGDRLLTLDAAAVQLQLTADTESAP